MSDFLKARIEALELELKCVRQAFIEAHQDVPPEIAEKFLVLSVERIKSSINKIEEDGKEASIQNDQHQG